MDAAPAPATRGRHLLDGAFVLALLTVSIVGGWGLLAPPALLATTLGRPQPAPKPPAVVAELPPRPPLRVEPAPPPLPTWPKTVTGQVLDGERRPVAGASVVVGGREHRAGADREAAAERHGVAR